MATGARPERISGKAREACSVTIAKSHTIARPKPKPKALPWTSATLINGEDRSAALNLIRQPDSRRIAAGVRPARSRPVQKSLPRARMRKTRARGFEASFRSSASMASNITPVTSLPWPELSRVKVRTSAVRSITTPLPSLGLEEALGFLLCMAGTVYNEYTPVKWSRSGLHQSDLRVYAISSGCEEREREERKVGICQALPDGHPVASGKEWPGQRDSNSRPLP